MSNSIKDQTIQSIKWTTIQTVLIALLGAVTQVIMARFMSPENFGYIAVIMITIGVMTKIEDYGISSAVIQRPTVHRTDASSLFFFNIIISVVIAISLFFFAPYLSSILSLDRLSYYLRFCCIIPLVSGPNTLFRSFLEKKLLFKQLSIIDGVRAILYALIITILLISGMRVMAVIIAQILTSFLATCAIIYYCYRNNIVKIGIAFKIRSVLDYFSFGFYVGSKQILTFLTSRVDEMLIAYYLSPEILGVYHFGKELLEKIRMLISKSLSKVLFPAFSKLLSKNHSIQSVSNYYSKMSYYLALISFPVFTSIALTAHLFVPVIFGDKWLESILVFRVVSISLIFTALTANVSSALLYAYNKPKVVLFIDIITSILYFSTLSLVGRYGIHAVLAIYITFNIFKTTALQFFANKSLETGMIKYLSIFKCPGIYVFAMAVSILGLQIILKSLVHSNILLIICMIGGTTTFLLVSYFVKKDDLQLIISILVKNKFQKQAI